MRFVLVMGRWFENFALVDYIANGVDGHPLVIRSREHLSPENRGISADRCSWRCLRGSGRFEIEWNTITRFESAVSPSV